MSVESFDDYPPGNEEDQIEYCRRLEEIGHEEMFIKKALAHHYKLGNAVFSVPFDEFEIARLRHITMLRLLQPNRSDYSMTRKIRKNLGLDDDQAKAWLDRFKKSGDVSFLGIEALLSK